MTTMNLQKWDAWKDFNMQIGFISKKKISSKQMKTNNGVE